ncbi:MAG: hypothetical protein R6W72_00675 [Desulfurivibrionaceae bacterium]
MSKSQRNIFVEQAADLIISEVDRFVAGNSLSKIPSMGLRNKIQQYLKHQGGSVKLAALFLLAYSLVDESWNFSSIPIGIRGKYGDKRLASELTERYATFHKSITAFGENLGWKGNVRNFDLGSDPRFEVFIKIIRKASASNRKSLLSYLCSEIADTRVVPKALPNLPSDYLTYARSLSLFLKLCSLQSEGHIQQFVVAAILTVHRKKFSAEVVTHHPHASDKFDGTCGDIEEFFEGQLINAYEVTVRDDWKNRIPDLREKMHRAKLNKYILIASGIRNDPELSNPMRLIKFTDKTNFDLAIVDLEDFIRVFCSELKAKEILESINTAYEFLINPKLCGRSEFIQAYKNIVDNWLDG